MAHKNLTTRESIVMALARIEKRIHAGVSESKELLREQAALQRRLKIHIQRNPLK